MSFKDLLVQVDDTKPCGARLDLAARLARDFGAHLVGVYAFPSYNISAYLAGQIPPEILAAQEEIKRESAEKVRAAFETRMNAAGVNAEWRSVEGDPARVITLHARYVDLAIVGQTDPEDNASELYSHVPEEVVLAAGRPVLVIPYAGRFERFGERIMVAWNASRESTRAVADAMPMLERAKHVTVLAINPKGGEAGHGDVPGADISLNLARHGVKAEAARVTAEDIDVGNILLSRAADDGADMLVMGAYGRSRIREVVMGGATRELLRHMTVPVLMSH